MFYTFWKDLLQAVLIPPPPKKEVFLLGTHGHQEPAYESQQR